MAACKSLHFPEPDSPILIMLPTDLHSTGTGGGSAVAARFRKSNLWVSKPQTKSGIDSDSESVNTNLTSFGVLKKLANLNLFFIILVVLHFYTKHALIFR